VSNEAAVAEQSRTAPLGAAAAPLGYLALGITLLAFGLLGTGIVNGAGVRDAGTLAVFVRHGLRRPGRLLAHLGRGGSGRKRRGHPLPPPLGPDRTQPHRRPLGQRQNDP
jgi:hypothetical protein